VLLLSQISTAELSRVQHRKMQQQQAKGKQPKDLNFPKSLRLQIQGFRHSLSYAAISARYKSNCFLTQPF